MYDCLDVINKIKESTNQSSIYVGCDSKRFRHMNELYIVYATVVLIHLDSKHGVKIYDFQKVEKDYGSLKQRLLNETMMACEIAYEILPHVENRTFEVHLDLNPNPLHKSHNAVKEAVGYVLGITGKIPKLKPESFASSTAADKIVCKFARKRAVEKFFQH